MSAKDLIGRVVGGRYKVDRVIGKGGMGTIYEVSHQVLGRKFALKTLSAHYATDPKAMARFFREADLVAKLRHPNVVDIFGWEHLEDGSPCIIMEYLAGEDLAARIRRDGPMSWNQILHISTEVFSALEVAHHVGIIHRDLKPANIFLSTDDARNETAKLLDFGLSKVREGAGAESMDARVKGTPAYMAPEQARGQNKEVGPHTDLWAMGAILHEMATGQVAFPGTAPIQVMYRICHGAPEPLKETRTDAPDEFVDVVARAMSREPERMFKNAAEMRDALRLALSTVITRTLPSMSGAGAVAVGTEPATDRPSEANEHETLRMGEAPPIGTITFLFTELLDTARLWEQHGELMKDVVARYDSVLHEAMNFHEGYVFKTTNDGFWVAFKDPKAAVSAALAAQRMLERAPWTIPGVKVRMAMHTGPAHERGGDYYGPTLNRIARLLALAQGRQVILSGATREVLADNLPAGATLIDLGVHPLRDLTRPEHIFQLNHADLPPDPGVLLTPSHLRHNLPSEISVFVGREQELQDVRENLRRHRLVTISGLGGCGKTRLVLQVASQSLSDFGDGVWLIELASLTDGGLVPQKVAQVLELVREDMMAPTAPWIDKLVQHLADKQTLLVLDNCEHLVAACADLADTLLRKCPKLRILAATREPLNVEGEVSHRLATLSVPANRNLDDAAAVDSVNCLSSAPDYRIRPLPSRGTMSLPFVRFARSSKAFPSLSNSPRHASA
jgi:class 3 adenylate cyclase